MRVIDGLRARIGLAMAGGKSPWGGGAGSGSGDGSGDGSPDNGQPASGGSDESKGGKSSGPRNPWLPPSSGGGTGSDGGRRGPNIEDLFKGRGPEGPRRTGGGGGNGPTLRLPPRPNGKSWFPLAVAGIGALWLAVTSFHQIGTKDQGIVTWLGGQYSRKMDPGFQLTLPWPVQNVTTMNVSEIRGLRIGTEGQKLILTGDQNLVDLSYLIRWKIRDLALYTYQLEDPQLALTEVAEAAMRASVAEQKLDDVVSGAGRAEIELAVRQRMQRTLDAYKSGIIIEGVAIEKADPPEKTVEAFKEVSAAQQTANATRNRARAYAQQVLARAEGDASAFDQIYAQYKLAPEVTRRRLYYETMESVLGKVDKTIVEANGVTPYLPLPEIRKQAAKPDAVVTGGQ